MLRSVGAVVTVLIALVVIWYAAAVWMNSTWAIGQAEKRGEVLSFTQLITETMDQKRPRLPTPHQVFDELWSTTVEKKVTSKRSLVFHGWITLQSTLWGFALGVSVGIALAVGMVYARVRELSVMPWAVISQTIPIVALAPMIIILSSSAGIEGRGFPRAIISA